MSAPAPTVSAPAPAVSAPALVESPSSPPPTRRRTWIAPVVIAGCVVVAAAVTLGVVFGLPARDTLPPAPLGTVDFR